LVIYYSTPPLVEGGQRGELARFVSPETGFNTLTKPFVGNYGDEYRVESVVGFDTGDTYICRDERDRLKLTLRLGQCNRI
jgi:hypothetical protein